MREKEYRYIVQSDTENCSFGVFETEGEAIRWAKLWRHWPKDSWRVVRLYPCSNRLIVTKWEMH